MTKHKICSHYLILSFIINIIFVFTHHFLEFSVVKFIVMLLLNFSLVLVSAVAYYLVFYVMGMFLFLFYVPCSVFS